MQEASCLLDCLDRRSASWRAPLARMNADLLLSMARRHFSTCKLLLTMLGSVDTGRQLSSVATASAWVAAA